jgi:hypothetical protein
MSRVILIFLCILLVGLGGWVFRQYHSRHWDGETRFTIVDVKNESGSMEILSADPQTRQAIKLELPGDLEITTVGGKGKWKVESVVRLVKKYGGRWAADSVADFLGIAYTDVRPEMNFWDKWRWWLLEKNADWEQINLKGNNLITQHTDPDGVSITEMSNWWQSKASEWFYSTNLAKEGLVVEIFNSTGIAGLAGRAARPLDKAGIKVAKLGDSSARVEKCLIKTTRKMKTDTGIKWLAEMYNCRIENDDQLDEKQVQLFVGSEYLARLTGSSGIN